MSASPSASTLIVDVTGWVREPGVYGFAAGDRIVDAIERAAGGARRGADLTAGTSRRRSWTVRRSSSHGRGPRHRAQAAPPRRGSAGSLVNINTPARPSRGAKLGIGEVLAATIVAYRDEHGLFASVDQLEDVSGIGPSTLEEIRDLVTI
ncbi:MAG: helix-hairpin-helix domain-containing protein [Actinomycetota bacterium]